MTGEERIAGKNQRIAGRKYLGIKEVAKLLLEGKSCDTCRWCEKWKEEGKDFCRKKYLVKNPNTCSDFYWATPEERTCDMWETKHR